MYSAKTRPRPQAKKKGPRTLGRTGGAPKAPETPSPAETPAPSQGYARYRESRTIDPPREGEVTEVREKAPGAEPAAALQETKADPAAAPSDELERLKTQNYNLRREVSALKDASDRFECPEGYSVELTKTQVPIKRPESGGESPGNANIYRTVARLERDGEVSWETEHLDRTQAIRACWLHALDAQQAAHENELLTNEKDFERRLEQQRKTFESKKKAEKKGPATEAKG
jgi:hypothetical protein